MSAGKTVISLFAFLMAIPKAPRGGLIVIIGKSLQTIYQNVFVLLQNTEILWNMLISRLRVVGARLPATMNPASANHRIRKEWILKGAEKNLVSFHFTMADNPALDPSYIADMERSYSGVFYDRMIRGLWTNAAGAIFAMRDPHVHQIPFAKMPPLQSIIGVDMDYGTTNATTAMTLGLTDEAAPRLVFMDE